MFYTRRLVIEKQIIQAAIQSREAFTRIDSLVNPTDFSDISKELWEKIEKYYATDLEADEVNLNLLQQIIVDEIPRHSDIILQELNSLSDTSVPNLIQELTKLKKKALADEIMIQLSTDPTSDKVYSMMDAFQTVDIEETITESVSSVASELITEMADPSNLIRMYPNVLNEALDGGVIRGNNILVFARGNIGKTMFIINLLRGMARDGLRVLHLINEEPKKQIMLRYVSRCSGLNKKEVYADIDTAIVKANAAGLNNIFVEDINPGTFKEIRGLIERVKPDVVAIDQLRNVKVKDESKPNQLEIAATEARNLGKKYNIVTISVTQAGDSASNKLVLTESDIDNSKTGIPGQMDLIIGLGADDTQKASNMRTLTIVKNKITPLHDFFPCRVDVERSKIVST